jgi:hypothetical protein
MIGSGRLSAEGSGAMYTECSNGEPDAPMKLKEMEEFRTTTSLKVTWEDGKCDGNSAIESYTVVYRARGSSSDESEKINADLHYFEITGLESREGYDVKIYATNANGNSDNSNTVTVTPILNTIPGSVPPAPTNVGFDLETMTATSMTVMWSQNGNGNSPIKEYIVAVSKDNSTPREISQDASQMSIELTGLNIGS